MLLVPGVVEAIVDEAVAEVRPALASLAQTIQPFLALVFTVAVRGVGLDATEAVVRLPSASVLPLSENENAEGTVAETTIWSFVMLAVVYEAVSIVAGALVWVVTLPRLEPEAAEATETAPLFIQLKQYKVPTVRSPLGNVTV